MKNFLIGLKLFVIFLFGVMIGLGSIYICNAEELNLKGKYFEQGGCVYLIGKSPTQEETASEIENYKARLDERYEQIKFSQKLEHDITLAEINARAMRDYLIANGLPLREVAEAIKSRLPNNQSVWIGDISSSSDSSVGNTTSTAYTGEISNTSNGGQATTGTIANSATGGNVGNNSNRNDANNTNNNTITSNNNLIGRDMKNSTITY